MPVSFKYILYLLLLVIGCCPPMAGHAATGEKPILMICSYNPGAYPTSANVSDFMDEYQRLGGKRGVVIENMNCKSFSDFPRWKGVMENILDKYRGSQEPALIILFGQEAWASYLSLNDSVTGEVPVMCALTSRNVVLLPDDGKDLAHWMPESSDFYEDSLKHQVCGGFLYEYDIASNIRMIRAILCTLVDGCFKLFFHADRRTAAFDISGKRGNLFHVNHLYIFFVEKFSGFL